MIDENPQDIVNIKRIRWAVLAFYFSQGLVFSSFASRIPDIKNAIGINDAELGTILLMISFGQMIGMAMSGFLVAKLGSRNILLFTLPFYLLSLISMSLATTEYTIMASFVFFGIFGNFVNISINTQGVNSEILYKKSIMSSFHGAWSIGGFWGSIIGLLLINQGFDLFWHFLTISVLVTLLVFFNYKYLPADIKKETTEKDGTKTKKNRPEGFLFLLGCVAFSAMFIEGTMFDWSGIYFEDIVKAEPSLVAIGFAGFMVMMGSGRFVADYFNQKYGRKTVIQVCGCLSAIGLLVAVAYPNIVVTTLAFMLIGLGTSSIVPTIYSLAGSKTKISTGLALTVVSSIGFSGFLIGPPIIGYISHATNLRYSFAFAALFAILIIVLVSNIKIFKKDK